MKPVFTIIFLLFLRVDARAADTLTTKLINTAYLEVVSTDTKYYYLLETGKNPRLDTDYLKNELINDKTLLEEIPFREFAEGIQSDAKTINWNNYNLIKAKCVDSKHLPKYLYGIRIYHYMPSNTPDSAMIKADTQDELFLKYVPDNTPDSTIKRLYSENIIPIPFKKGMSKKRIKTIEKKAIERYEDRPIEEKNSYYFSKPIFSKNHNYAQIELSHNDHGAFYIFKFADGNWTKLFVFGKWVY